MTDLAPIDPPAAPASTDLRIIELWLEGRPHGTVRSYRREALALLDFAAKPLRSIILDDLSRYRTTFTDQASATQARRIASIKSLFGFAHRTGYLTFDPATVLRTPAIKNVLAERILEEPDVVRMIALERHPRNHALLRTLYLAGLRISEAGDLKWKDITKRGASGQINVFGKGGKTRTVLLPSSLYKQLMTLRGETGPDEWVFRSRRSDGEGGRLGNQMIHRIIKTAAARAGLSPDVSAHWLRHAHASHALDRGAPPHLVQATLGHADLKTTSRYAHAKANESSATYLVG